MIIVAGSPVIVTPPEGDNPRRNLSLVLVGVDGSTWDLINGPVKLMPGVAGLSGPDPELWFRDSPGIDGSFYVGGRTPRGELTLPVRITAADDVTWRQVQTAFMRAIDPTGEATLLATAPDAETRSRGIRLSGGMSPAYDIDPIHIRHAVYSLDFTSAYPYWTGPSVTRLLNGSEVFPNTVGSVVVNNPGDVPSWVRWTVTGAAKAATFGIGTSFITLGSAFGSTSVLAAGQQRVVNTDPRVDVVAVTDQNGVDKWSDVTSRNFAAIPAGDSVVVRIGITTPGAGASIRLEFKPAYRQPWGLPLPGSGIGST